MSIEEGIDAGEDLLSRNVHLNGLSIVFLHHEQHLYIDKASKKAGLATVLLVNLVFFEQELAFVLEIEYTTTLGLPLHMVFDKFVIALYLLQVPNGFVSYRHVYVFLIVNCVKVNV